MHKPIKFIYALLIIAIVGSSVTWYLLREVRKNEVVMNATNVVVSETQITSVKKQDNVFHFFYDSPHIVGAVLSEDRKTIRSMDGISESKIKEINTILLADNYSHDISGDTCDAGSDDSSTNIYYIDKGFVFYAVSNSNYLCGAYPNNSVENKYIDLNATAKITENSASDIIPKNMEEIFKHFYPDLNKAYTDSKRKAINKTCYDGYVDREDGSNWDPTYIYSDLHPDLNPQNGIIWFRIGYFPHVIGICNDADGFFPIKIADILREVPQYVPKDSVLWKFADK